MIARFLPLAVWALVLLAPVARAAEVRFADLETARAVLTSDADGYFSSMSPADPTVRLLSEDPIPVAALKKAYAEGARRFTREERARLTGLLEAEAARLETLAGWLPETVLLIASGPMVEGGLPHTRANAIVLPGGPSPRGDQTGASGPQAGGKAGASGTDGDRENLIHQRSEAGTLTELFYHELFHVLSRHNKDKRDSLYALIGFKPCPRFELPSPYAERRITNPDAPANRHFVPVEANDETVKVIPLLYAVSKTYDPRRRPPGFSGQFRVGFVQVRHEEGRCHTVPARDGTPRIFRQDAIDTLYDVIGHNTRYVIHPEEVLADNFALLMTGQRPRDAWVVDALAEWLNVPADIGQVGILSDE